MSIVSEKYISIVEPLNPNTLVKSVQVSLFQHEGCDPRGHTHETMPRTVALP